MSNVNWPSLAGEILHAEFLNEEQKNVQKYIACGISAVLNNYGIIELELNNEQLIQGIVKIENIKAIMPNGMFIEYESNMYDLSLNITNSNQAMTPIYLIMTQSRMASNVSVQTLASVVSLPSYIPILSLTTTYHQDAIMLCEMTINNHGLYMAKPGAWLNVPNILRQEITQLIFVLYRYLLYLKTDSQVADRIPVIGFLYGLAKSSQVSSTVKEVYCLIIQIYTTIFAIAAQPIDILPYNVNKCVSACLDMISSIISTVNIQSKSEMILFRREDRCFSAPISAGVTYTDIFVIVEPGDINDVNTRWVKSEMRIASKSKIDEARMKRDLGIDRTITEYNREMIIARLNLNNSNWFIPGEQLCVDLPLDGQADITNIRLKINKS